MVVFSFASFVFGDCISNPCALVILRARDMQKMVTKYLGDGRGLKW